MTSVKRFFRGFRYAYEGIKYALSTQRNMKFHFFVSFFVLSSALFFHLSKMEILFLLLSITLVIVTELINTGVEKAVDLAMPDRHPIAKIAKDVAAASVLVSAVFAVAVGTIIFYEPVDKWIRSREIPDASFAPGELWLYLGLVLLTVIVAETRFGKSRFRPSLWTAIAFSCATFISLLTSKTIIALMAYSMSLLFLIMLYERRSRSMPSLLFGSVIGTVITVLAYYLSG
ncbi:diacylglycerol kinase [Paenibacillus sp. MBLB4367]|uniref:diacylglycerol kinase n=1 Tax=Paenibacillus sp. MBLB4367 TaxID=3384767 RepID=UPI0039082177